MQMDICSHLGFSVNDVISLHGFCTDPLGPSYGPTGDYLVDELANGVTDILNVQVEVERNWVYIPPHEEDVIQMKNEYLEAHQSEVNSKAHETDVDDVITSEVLPHDDDAKSVNPHCSSVQSLPERLKPVSAMKGGRERYGLNPPEQLTVKWAPDVYDPVPMSPSSHMVINRQHKHGKKKYKSKQKSRTKSRGSKSKDMGFTLC